MKKIKIKSKTKEENKLLCWKRFLQEEIFVISRKTGAIHEIKFPQKIVFRTIHENKFLRKNFFDTHENKFLQFLFTYLFQLMATVLYKTI